MRAALLTREFPPTTYGGAGTYVEFLVRHLDYAVRTEVHCFGEQRPGATAHATAEAGSGLGVLATEIAMADAIEGVDLVNSHTWYTGLAGELVRVRDNVPDIVSLHSLEPDRPWKAAVPAAPRRGG